jgi:uncharacterized membrane protein YdbT with pleckstrin-like domain
MDSQTAPVPNEEKTLWEGHSSQILNLPTFIVCGLAAGVLAGSAILLRTRVSSGVCLALAAATLIPLVIALGKWVQNQCRRYQVTTERIHLRQGVLSRKTDDLELYRVKDYLLVEPFLLRLFGLGNIVLTTTDEANPTLVIKAIPQIQLLRDQIRKQVELCRTRKGVRIAELE